MTKLAAGFLMCIGAASAGASVFFCYYSLRLAYLGAAGMIDTAHRTAGMRIGAAAFPILAFSFGWLGLACVRSAMRRFGSSG
jgi:hypothetical protein